MPSAEKLQENPVAVSVSMEILEKSQLDEAMPSTSDIATTTPEGNWSEALLTFVLARDDTNPKGYSNRKKHWIVFTIAVYGLLTFTSSTIYLPSLLSVENDLKTTGTLVNASVSIFMYIMGSVPLLWASVSDMYGRRIIYLVSTLIYVAGSAGCALSGSIYTLIVCRGLQAVGASALQVMGAGTISDIYISTERGRAFGWYNMGPMLGPAIGPIIGGALNQAFGWRSIFWFLAAYAFVTFILILLLLPETWRREPHVPRLLFNPLAALALLRNTAMTLAVTFVGVTYGCYFLSNTGISRTFALRYGFSPLTVGLCYFVPAAGCLLGSRVGGWYSDFVVRRWKDREGDSAVVVPEARLASVWAGCTFIPIGFVVYGWCLQKETGPEWPLVAQFVVGFAMCIVFVSISRLYQNQARLCNCMPEPPPRPRIWYGFSRGRPGRAGAGRRYAIHHHRGNHCHISSDVSHSSKIRGEVEEKRGEVNMWLLRVMIYYGLYPCWEIFGMLKFWQI